MVVGCCGSERANIMLPVLRIVPIKVLITAETGNLKY